jgi:hypothetical protein
VAYAYLHSHEHHKHSKGARSRVDANTHSASSTSMHVSSCVASVMHGLHCPYMGSSDKPSWRFGLWTLRHSDHKAHESRFTLVLITDRRAARSLVTLQSSISSTAPAQRSPCTNGWTQGKQAHPLRTFQKLCTSTSSSLCPRIQLMGAHGRSIRLGALSLRLHTATHPWPC